MRSCSGFWSPRSSFKHPTVTPQRVGINIPKRACFRVVIARNSRCCRGYHECKSTCPDALPPPQALSSRAKCATFHHFHAKVFSSGSPSAGPDRFSAKVGAEPSGTESCPGLVWLSFLGGEWRVSESGAGDTPEQSGGAVGLCVQPGCFAPRRVWSTTTDPEGVRVPARRLAFLCAATAGGVRDKTLKLGCEPSSVR